MEWLIFILIGAAMIYYLFRVAWPPISQYPDGKCYLCRKGVVLPGETCRKCGTYQPKSSNKLSS